MFEITLTRDHKAIRNPGPRTTLPKTGICPGQTGTIGMLDYINTASRTQSLDLYTNYNEA